MTILSQEKPNMFPNNFHRRLLVVLIIGSSFPILGQETEKASRKLKKVGLLFNSAKQNNFLFSDRDYDYQTNVIKAQLFYSLRKGEKWDINIILQPQAQFAKHQLLNPFYVSSDLTNVQELRDRFTQERNIALYQFELGFQLRTQLWDPIYFESTLGLGAGYISEESERLAKGFTFIENLSVGLAYQLTSSELYLGMNVGHVSNFDTQTPNDGYNILGFEIGYRILL